MERREVVEAVVMQNDPRTERVLQSVRAFHPVDERAIVAREQMIQFLQCTAQPFSRDVQRAHVTGSAVVLSAAGTLLHFHKLAKIWCGPGGHVDGDEFPWEAAERETFEETGIKAWGPFLEPTVVHVDVHETPNDHIHYDLRYLLVALPDEPNPPPDESQQVAWFLDDQACEVTDFSYRGALIEAQNLEVFLPR